MPKTEMRVFAYCRVGNPEQLSENEQKEVLLRKTKDNKATIIKKTAIHNDIQNKKRTIQ